MVIEETIQKVKDFWGDVKVYFANVSRKRPASSSDPSSYAVDEHIITPKRKRLERNAEADDLRSTYAVNKWVPKIHNSVMDNFNRHLNSLSELSPEVIVIDGNDDDEIQVVAPDNGVSKSRDNSGSNSGTKEMESPEIVCIGAAVKVDDVIFLGSPSQAQNTFANRCDKNMTGARRKASNKYTSLSKYSGHLPIEDEVAKFHSPPVYDTIFHKNVVRANNDHRYQRQSSISSNSDLESTRFSHSTVWNSIRLKEKETYRKCLFSQGYEIDGPKPNRHYIKPVTIDKMNGFGKFTQKSSKSFKAPVVDLTSQPENLNHLSRSSSEVEVAVLKQSNSGDLAKPLTNGMDKPENGQSPFKISKTGPSVTTIQIDEGTSSSSRSSFDNRSSVTLQHQVYESPYLKENYFHKKREAYNETDKVLSQQVKEIELTVRQNREKRDVELQQNIDKLDLRKLKTALVLVEEDKLPELTNEMMIKVNDAWKPSNCDLLVVAPNLSVRRKDMETLKGLNWLNDEVINLYFALLMERGKLDNFPTVYSANTFFYPKLISGGHAVLKRWTRKVDVFSYDMMLIPVHLGMHWCLAVVKFEEKKMEYYDSMGGRNDQCLQALRRYLEAESLDKKKTKFDFTGWQFENIKDIPQQMNGSDCGMFTCKYAEYISRKAKITFSQEDMPYFRKRMVFEILTNRLL